jgi:hypothetical protein
MAYPDDIRPLGDALNTGASARSAVSFVPVGATDDAAGQARADLFASL